MQRTARVNLDLSQEQKDAVIETIRLYSTVYDDYAKWFTSNKTTSKVLGHKAVYYTHNECGLPTALIQSARDNASESIKSYNSRFKDKKWKKTPTYTALSMRYNLRSMSLRGNLLTFSTTQKRCRVLIQLPSFFVNRYETHKLQAGRVGIDRHGVFYALLTFKIPDRSLKTEGKIVGIDRGVRNIVYTSEGVKYSSASVRANKRRHLYNRSQLNSKGTRSAKRKLKQQSDREARFSAHINHIISKRLASKTDVKTYVLEDLSNISKKKKIKWQKHSNKRLSDWSHAQLLNFLRYKCEENGIEIILIDPRYTSQDCSRCKNRSKAARNKSRYNCSRCGFKAHSDYNAALNIRDRGLETISVAQSQQQAAVNQPNAKNV